MKLSLFKVSCGVLISVMAKEEFTRMCALGFPDVESLVAGISVARLVRGV
jgi:hypothetical protein